MKIEKKIKKAGKFLSRSKIIHKIINYFYIHKAADSSDILTFSEFTGDMEVWTNYSDSPEQIEITDVGYRFLERGCYVDPRYGIHLTSQFKIIIENSGCHNIHIALQSLMAFLYYRGRDIHKLEKKSLKFCVSFAGEWTSNYFHWVSDWLTRFSYIYADKEILQHRITLIAPAELKSFQLDYLRELLPSRWTIYKPDRQEILHVERLAIYSVPKMQNIHLPNSYQLDNTAYIPESYETVNKKFKKIITTNSRELILLIQRESQNSRQIKNSNLLKETLKSEFPNKILVTAYLEYLPLKVQIGLFKRADVIVGAHGAGLTNIIFCESCKIIEIVPRFARIHYNPLAYHFKNQYSLVVGDNNRENQIFLQNSQIDEISHQIRRFLQI